MTDDTIDRREYVRLPKQFRVELQEFVFPLSRQPRIATESVDISAGGLRVDCPKRMQIGDKIQVKIFIPSLNKFHPGFMKVFESDTGQYLQAIAEIARVDELIPMTKWSLGIKFVDVDQDDWSALRRLIAKHTQ